jgi:hypothetical protein
MSGTVFFNFNVLVPNVLVPIDYLFCIFFMQFDLKFPYSLVLLKADD